MATAIITITDCEDGSGAHVSVSFGPAGLVDDSTAHALAATAIRAMSTDDELAEATVSTEVCGHG